MRRAHAILLSLLSVFAPASAQAQASEVYRRNAVLADVGLHVISLGYQRTTDRFLSLQVSAGLYVPWLINSNVGGLAGEEPQPQRSVQGGVLRLRCFVHPLGRAPDGLWVSPFAQLGMVSGQRELEKVQGATFAVGLSLGWAWRIRDRWLISLGVGGQLHRAAFPGPAGGPGLTEAPGFVRFGPTVDLNTGLAF